MNIILFGSQGVGKGTYAQILRENYNIPHISTGDLFREEIAKKTDAGKKIERYVKTGELVPDEITIEVLKKRLDKADAKKGYLLDGFPRTLEQAEALERITRIDRVFHYYADKEVIVQRLSGRVICRKCGYIYNLKNAPTKKPGICDKCGGETYQRDDDKPEAIRERLELFKKKTMPLLDYYRKKGYAI
jgi:adenylate kinase